MFELVQFAGWMQEVLASQPETVKVFLQQLPVTETQTQPWYVTDASQIDDISAEPVTGMTQLDPEQFRQLMESHGLELPADWSLPNFTSPAA